MVGEIPLDGASVERTPPRAGSGVGSRLRFPVVFLDGDGTALLLPGAAVRTGLFRFRLVISICGKTTGQGMVSSREGGDKAEKRKEGGGRGVEGGGCEGESRVESGWDPQVRLAGLRWWAGEGPEADLLLDL